MNEWMNEYMSEWMNTWVSEWMTHMACGNISSNKKDKDIRALAAGKQEAALLLIKRTRTVA